ncbi:hypothetical protein K435DRAFT_878699 [Dendrothele bispora CBS 962.96]|uniref:Uncharacterized protein n=1 Tax=Dendrothele bispora (strain CBS 962.96) TaxID=1314807 RepID=A0A4S8KMH2_DENBC|nr:hypothetical protein K435DRAFT_878699 [Dendrothele bispora CBS 962.96]
MTWTKWQKKKASTGGKKSTTKRGKGHARILRALIRTKFFYARWRMEGFLEAFGVVLDRAEALQQQWQQEQAENLDINRENHEENDEGREEDSDNDDEGRNEDDGDESED